MDADEARERGMGAARGCVFVLLVMIVVAAVVFGVAWYVAV